MTACFIETPHQSEIQNKTLVREENESLFSWVKRYIKTHGCDVELLGCDFEKAGFHTVSVNHCQDTPLMNVNSWLRDAMPPDAVLVIKKRYTEMESVVYDFVFASQDYVDQFKKRWIV